MKRKRGGWVETFGLSALCTTNNNTHKLYPMVLKVGAGARKKRKGFLFLYTHTHTHTFLLCIQQRFKRVLTSR